MRCFRGLRNFKKEEKKKFNLDTYSSFVRGEVWGGDEKESEVN